MTKNSKKVGLLSLRFWLYLTIVYYDEKQMSENEMEEQAWLLIYY